MKRRLIFIGLITCLLLLISIALFASDYKYVSSKYSIWYHRPTCKKALKINPQIRVTYKTAKEALDAGKKPCPLCKPPTKDSSSGGVLQNF
jgi:hypothetical protein